MRARVTQSLDRKKKEGMEEDFLIFFFMYVMIIYYIWKCCWLVAEFSLGCWKNAKNIYAFGTKAASDLLKKKKKVETRFPKNEFCQNLQSIDYICLKFKWLFNILPF